MSDAKDLIRRIKARRAELGWDQLALADKAGVSKSTIKNIESGANSNPKQDTLQAIADSMDVPLDWLLFGTSAFEGEEYHNEAMAAIADLRDRIARLEKSQAPPIPEDLQVLFATFTSVQWNNIRTMYGLPKVKNDSEEETS